MKKLLIVTLVSVLIIGLSFNVLAEKNNNFSRDKLRANGGISLGFIKLDLSSLNNLITKEGFSELNNNITLTGGGGIGGNIAGHRFGGIGTGGSTQSHNNNKKAILDVGFGGFVYEHGVYEKNNIDIALSGMVGAGSLSLKLLYQDPSTFEKVIEGIDQNNTPYSISMNRGFMAFEPRVNLHYQFHERFGMELAVGYLLTSNFQKGWKIGDKIVEDGPTGILNSPHINLRFSYGF